MTGVRGGDVRVSLGASPVRVCEFVAEGVVQGRGCGIRPSFIPLAVFVLLLFGCYCWLLFL